MASVELARLFVIRMLSALFAELLQHDFLGRVDFVSVRYVILGFTYRADHCECDALVFLCHSSGDYSGKRAVTQGVDC